MINIAFGLFIKGERVCALYTNPNAEKSCSTTTDQGVECHLQTLPSLGADRAGDNGRKVFSEAHLSNKPSSVADSAVSSASYPLTLTAHQQRRLPEHRAQPDVPPAGRRERELRQEGDREPGEEAEGEEGRAGLPHHRGDHQRRAPQQVRDHPEDAGRAAAGRAAQIRATSV